MGYLYLAGSVGLPALHDITWWVRFGQEQGRAVSHLGIPTQSSQRHDLTSRFAWPLAALPIVAALTTAVNVGSKTEQERSSGECRTHTVIFRLHRRNNDEFSAMAATSGRNYGTGTFMGAQPRAVGFIRKDVHSNGVDIHALARRHGYRLVFTVTTETAPFITALAVAQHLYEHAATAVIVPSFEHAATIRYAVTDLAALITPMQVYPRGYHWPVIEP